MAYRIINNDSYLTIVRQIGTSSILANLPIITTFMVNLTLGEVSYSAGIDLRKPVNMYDDLMKTLFNMIATHIKGRRCIR